MLARKLIDSLEDAEPKAAALWAEEIRRRFDEIEAGTAEIEDWDEVRDRLRAAARS